MQTPTTRLQPATTSLRDRAWLYALLGPDSGIDLTLTFSPETQARVDAFLAAHDNDPAAGLGFTGPADVADEIRRVWDAEAVR